MMSCSLRFTLHCSDPTRTFQVVKFESALLQFTTSMILSMKLIVFISAKNWYNKKATKLKEPHPHLLPPKYDVVSDPREQRWAMRASCKMVNQQQTCKTMMDLARLR